MNRISKICVTLIKLIPIAWVMLGLEYGACWWEYQKNAYELVMSAGGVLLIAWVLILVGESLSETRKAPAEELSIESCLARIGAEIFVLALVSVSIGS